MILNFFHLFVLLTQTGIMLGTMTGDEIGIEMAIEITIETETGNEIETTAPEMMRIMVGIGGARKRERS